MQLNILTKKFNCWIHPCILVNQEDHPDYLFIREGGERIMHQLGGYLCPSLRIISGQYWRRMIWREIEVFLSRIVETPLNCRTRNPWCFQVVMKTRKIMENGNSTEEMGQEIQVATSDQIRINYSPFSVNLCESAANKAIRFVLTILRFW